MGVKHLWRTLERGGAVEALDGADPAQHDEILHELEGAVVAVDLSAWRARRACAHVAAPACPRIRRRRRRREGDPRASAHADARAARPRRASRAQADAGADAAGAGAGLRLGLCVRAEGRV
jgi:hypothetical protein